MLAHGGKIARRVFLCIVAFGFLSFAACSGTATPPPTVLRAATATVTVAPPTTLVAPTATMTVAQPTTQSATPGTLPTDTLSGKYHRGAPTELPATLAPIASLTHGPLVGAVTAHSARVFVRTDRPSQVQLKYSTAFDMSEPKTSGVHSTNAAGDFTTQVPMLNLDPDTTYYLDVLVNGVPQFHQAYPKFKTFPPKGAAVQFKWVMLTDFSYKPSPAFEASAAENPALVVIGGDFDHSNPSTLEQRREMFRELYDPHGARGDFVTFILRQFAVAHFWDDHDMGWNNTDRTYPLKALALDVLQEYFPLYPVTQYGDWQKFSYGQTEFFLLDARSERDPDLIPDGPGKSMLDGDHLGDAGQLQWLEQGLVSSTATWKFIVSPVVFNATVPKTDAWYGFRYERTALVQFIHSHKIHGVVFVTGDSHFGGLDNGTNSDFPEMQVPSPNFETCQTAAAPGTWSNGFYTAPDTTQRCSGYGVITVLTHPDRLELEVDDTRGRTKLQMQVNLDQAQ